VIFIILSTYF